MDRMLYLNYYDSILVTRDHAEKKACLKKYKFVHAKLALYAFSSWKPKPSYETSYSWIRNGHVLSVKFIIDVDRIRSRNYSFLRNESVRGLATKNDSSTRVPSLPMNARD